MPISVTVPIDLAIRRTRRVLFQPFRASKWFTLGFCAFLAYLGEGGGCSFNWPFPGGGGRAASGPVAPGTPGAPSPVPSMAPAPGSWRAANAYWLIPVIVGGVALIVLLTVLVTWLRSRGAFMFLDGLVRNRGAVVEPWKRFRTLGHSLFGFSLVFSLVVLAVIAAIAGVGVGIAWSDIRAGRFGAAAIIALVVCVPLVILTGVTSSIISLLLTDFVVPAMYLRNERVMPAWGTVRREILRGHAGPIVLFYLMKIVLSMAVGILSVMATCLTCCLAALPYLGTVILLPLFVFRRSYTLHFLQQFGPQWQVFVHDDVPSCAFCGYNLTGNVSGICPECGTPVPPARAAEPA